MARRKTKKKDKKILSILTPKGRPKKIIPPELKKARNLRGSLLRRILPELKDTTPTIDELFKLLNKDTHRCYYCLENLILDNVTIDHKIPLNREGLNSLSNLCICCANCNTVKGSLSDQEYRSLIELVKYWDDNGEYIFRRLKQGNTIFGR